MRNHWRSNDAISEVVGTLLLLSVSVIIFSAVYVSLLSTDTPSMKPSLDVLATIDSENNIVIEHRGGVPVNVNSKLLIDIAGIRQPEEPIESYIDHTARFNEWNLGEQLTYPTDINITDLRVEAKIVDVNSNSLTLLSLLQDGYTVPPFGKGGIWHFNQDTGDQALDSSGNNNHGTIYGAERINDGINGTNALFFNGLNDYVYVPYKYGLDIRGNMSIEAWVNAKIIPEPINQTEFDADVGYFPNITHVVNDIYAVVYRQGTTKNKPIILKTLNIQSDGWVINTSIDMITVDSRGFEPSIVQINSSTVAVIYGDSSQQGQIKTYTIAKDGTIQNSTSIDQKSFGQYCEETSVTKVTDNVYAIAYGSDGKNSGYIRTARLYNNGTITLLQQSNELNDKCSDPSIQKISNNLYIVAFIKDANTDILSLKTFEINETYHINETTYESTYSDGCDDPKVFLISQNVVGVSFTNNSDQGTLRTYLISPTGEITFTGNQITFETDKCFDSDVIAIDDDLYAIAYEGQQSHIGKLAKIQILSDGTIEKIISVKTYNPSRGVTPNIFKISRHIFGIVYRGKTPHPGGLATFSFFNDIEYPYQNAGIYREDIFSLFANATRVIGGINDQSLSSSLNPGWNHIALTYDQSELSLYVNGSLRTSTPYSSPLEINNNPLYIGDYFYGKMDEVALFDHCLTADEIANHYNNPGDFA